MNRLVQLKATAYDILAELERLQIHLREVNQAILEESRRQAQTAPPGGDGLAPAQTPEMPETSGA